MLGNQRGGRRGRGRRNTGCDHCGGSHPNVPTENVTKPGDEYGAYCPHCGNWHGLDGNPEEMETHPAVPDDEPLTVVCNDCNGGFKIRV